MTTPATPAAQSSPGSAAPSAAPSTAASPPTGGGAAGGGAAAAPGATPGTPAAPAAAPAADQPTFARLQLQLRQEQQARKTLEQRVAALTPLEQQMAELKDPAKRWGAAEKLGLKYQEWTETLLREAGATTDTPRSELPPEVKAALERIDALESELKAEKEAKVTVAQQQQAEASRAYASKLLTDNAAKYELAAAIGAADNVVSEFIRKRAENGGIDPDEHEICAHVEQQIEVRLTDVLTSVGKTAKGKALIAKLTGAAPAQNGAQASPRAQTGQPSGLTNGMSAESGDGVDLSKLTDAQLRARALERLRRAPS